MCSSVAQRRQATSQQSSRGRAANSRTRLVERSSQDRPARGKSSRRHGRQSASSAVMRRRKAAWRARSTFTLRTTFPSSCGAIETTAGFFNGRTSGENGATSARRRYKLTVELMFFLEQVLTETRAIAGVRWHLDINCCPHPGLAGDRQRLGS